MDFWGNIADVCWYIFRRIFLVFWYMDFWKYFWYLVISNFLKTFLAFGNLFYKNISDRYFSEDISCLWSNIFFVKIFDICWYIFCENMLEFVFVVFVVCIRSVWPRRPLVIAEGGCLPLTPPPLHSHSLSLLLLISIFQYYVCVYTVTHSHSSS